MRHAASRSVVTKAEEDAQRAVTKAATAEAAAVASAEQRSALRTELSASTTLQTETAANFAEETTAHERTQNRLKSMEASLNTQIAVLVSKRDGWKEASETANEELAEQRLRAQELEGHLRASERKLSAAETREAD